MRTIFFSCRCPTEQEVAQEGRPSPAPPSIPESGLMEQRSPGFAWKTNPLQYKENSPCSGDYEVNGTGGSAGCTQRGDPQLPLAMGTLDAVQIREPPVLSAVDSLHSVGVIP